MTDKRSHPQAPQGQPEEEPGVKGRKRASAPAGAQRNRPPEDTDNPLEAIGRAVSETVLGSEEVPAVPDRVSEKRGERGRTPR